MPATLDSATAIIDEAVRMVADETGAPYSSCTRAVAIALARSAIDQMHRAVAEHVRKNTLHRDC